jgi:hypothetical protein
MRSRTFGGAIAAVAYFGSGALASYSDPTILTIESAPNTPPAAYTIEELRSDFPNQEILTRTPWTKEGEQIRYKGPAIMDVLQKHRLNADESVHFVGYDDFISEVLIEEIRTYDPIFAIERECQEEDRESGRCATDQEFTTLTAEEQGPIFLVWPYDDLPTAYVPARNSIWVWFVVAVRPVE